VLWRLVKGVGVLLLLVVAAAASLLAWTHFQLQNHRAALPLVADVLDLAKAGDLPIDVKVIETATQPMPRSAVLDPSADPSPNAPYVMTHPAFVVEWADGRLLLIDTGMTRDKAIQFGGLIERFGGAAPLVPLTTTATALGDAAKRVGGIVFTHLHIDHVDGLRVLCAPIGHQVKIFMTSPQIDTWTFTTAEGKRVVDEAECATPTRLAARPPIPIEGFPGVGVIAAGGHTPGSQIIAVATRDRAGALHRYLFAGDIANSIDGVRHDIPKPFLYRIFIVPEDDDRLGELRRYLHALEQEHGFTVVVSHDEGALKETGIPAWGS
jgi:glyoxylase-like metal-dependent hydrolase (beta-lactamase superfamily II)